MQDLCQSKPEAYELITRSVRLNGYSTSIRLEAYFWSILDEISARQNMTAPRFMSTLYDEVTELRGEVGKFHLAAAGHLRALYRQPAGQAGRDRRGRGANHGRHKGIPPLVDAVA